MDRQPTPTPSRRPSGGGEREAGTDDQREAVAVPADFNNAPAPLEKAVMAIAGENSDHPADSRGLRKKPRTYVELSR